MKNKFCMQCNGKRGELFLPISRVRGLPEALHDLVTNSSEGGVWSKAPNAFGMSVSFRVINNTSGCVAPRLVVFENQAPELNCGVDWLPLQPEWLSGDYLHVYVSRGTLVPAFDRKRSAASLPMPSFLPKPTPVPRAVFGNGEGAGQQIGGLGLHDDSIFSFHVAPQPLVCPGPNAVDLRPPPILAPHSGGRSTPGVSGGGCAPFSHAAAPHPLLTAAAPPRAVSDPNDALLSPSSYLPFLDSPPKPFGQLDLPDLSAGPDALSACMVATPVAGVGTTLDAIGPETARALMDPETARALMPPPTMSCAGMAPSSGAAPAAPILAPALWAGPSNGAGEQIIVAADDASLRGTKRPKSEAVAKPAPRVSDSLGSNDSGGSSSREESVDSGSWATGTYLIAKFTGFCAKLARKRRTKAQSGDPAPNATGLKLSILSKLDALLEHGDNTQLARIEKSLADLHLERVEKKGLAVAAVQPPLPSSAPMM